MIYVNIVGCTHHTSRLGRLDLHRFLGWGTHGDGQYVGTSEKSEENDNNSCSGHDRWSLYGWILFMARLHCRL